MTKVGIITFHRAKNYGAMLQAFALQQVISQKYDSYIIDYRSPYIEKSYYSFPKGRKNFLKDLKLFMKFHRVKMGILVRNIRFRYFRKKFFRTTQPYFPDTIYNANDNFDLFVSGSDQIWNMRWSDHDWNYFLEFAQENKKCSYAASISKPIEKKDEQRIKFNLESYQKILVREKKGIEVLKELGIEKEICAVCDPVFLLKKADWKHLFLLKPPRRKKYVLLYLVARQSYGIEFAKNLARQKGIELIYLNQLGFCQLPDGMINVPSAGPIQFLEYILYAEDVITTSFHGLAFSLIFQVPFFYEVCRDGGNDNSRIENIAGIFEVQHREIVGESLINNTIDWRRIAEIMQEYRKDSLDELWK